MTEPNEPIQEAVLIERGLYEQVVEGLGGIIALTNLVGFQRELIRDTAQRLLAQLTEKQS